MALGSGIRKRSVTTYLTKPYSQYSLVHEFGHRFVADISFKSVACNVQNALVSCFAVSNRIHSRTEVCNQRKPFKITVLCENKGTCSNRSRALCGVSLLGDNVSHENSGYTKNHAHDGHSVLRVINSCQMT